MTTNTSSSKYFSKKNFHYPCSGDIHLKKVHGHNFRSAQEHQYLYYLQIGQLGTNTRKLKTIYKSETNSHTKK